MEGADLLGGECLLQEECLLAEDFLLGASGDWKENVNLKESAYWRSAY